jgi:hypothetical protein
MRQHPSDLRPHSFRQHLIRRAVSRHSLARLDDCPAGAIAQVSAASLNLAARNSRRMSGFFAQVSAPPLAALRIE